jgi:hypothetical protein
MEWVKEKIYQARLQRNQIQAQGAVTARGGRLSRDPEEAASRHSSFFTLTHKLSWLAGGMVLGSMIVTMVWKSGLVDVGDDLRVTGLSGSVPEQHRNLVELPSQFSTTDTGELRKDIILLTEQVQTLATSIAALGNELAPDPSQQQGAASGIVPRIETLPPPAAGMPNVSASDGKDSDKPGDATNSPLVAIKEITPAASGIQTQETITNNGPWVINLASLPHKADAERFMANAGSRGVAADLYQVTVRGKNYWRVHVPGFSTAAEAKAKASLIKEKLGLKDVWVAKR